MNVKKIFITLVTIVACVILGAFVLNTLMPNVVENLIDATESMLYRATSLEFDFNKNGTTGKGSSSGLSFTQGKTDKSVTHESGNNVTGFGSAATPSTGG